MRVNLWIPDKLFKEFEKYREETNMSRSALISELIADEIAIAGHKKENIVKKGFEEVAKERATDLDANVKLCKHRSMVGLCRFGCKK